MFKVLSDAPKNNKFWGYEAPEVLSGSENGVKVVSTMLKSKIGTHLELFPTYL